MKKLVSVFLAALFIFSVIPTNAAFGGLLPGIKAAAVSADSLTFKLNADGKSYSVTGCSGNPSGALVIPAKHGGLPVTEIADNAFFSRTKPTDITSVTIPESVTRIGDYAFFNNGKMTAVTIPDSVKNIGEYAFYGCLALTSVKIPAGINELSRSVFGASGLKTVTVPSNVKTIGYSAFSDCNSLTSVVISSGVTKIQSSAFYSCRNLSEITLPATVSVIGRGAFNVTGYYNNSANWENGVLYCGKNLLAAKPDIKGAYTVKAGTKCIADAAFATCENLTAITIPEGVTYIGEQAFYQCKIKTIAVPASVKTIGAKAFGYTPNGDTDIVISGFAIKGYAGTVAETYAKNNGIKFVKLAAVPALTKLAGISNGAAGVTVTWNAAAGAENYFIYRKAGSATTWSRLAVVAGSVKTYTDTSVKSGTSYTYTVKAQNETGAGAYDKTGLTVVYLSLPAAAAANVNGGVKVSWGKITGATGYIVYRKASGETAWTRLATVTGNATVSYTDKTPKSGTGYRYTVRAFSGSNLSSYSSKGVVIRYLAQPAVTVANANGSVTVKWGKVTGAKGYYIYRKAGGATNWSRLATVTSGSTVTYTDKNVNSGTAYQYTVKAYNDIYLSSYCSGVAVRYLAPAKVTSATSAKAGITVKWDKVTGAASYYVYRKTGSGAWVRLASVTGNATVSYLDKSAAKGVTYTYCVKPVNGKFAGVYGNSVNCKDLY